MESLNYVDFLIYLERNALGTSESYCVLPSHLMQVRGLKQSVLIIPDREDEIAPHAGARIETKLSACEKEG